VKKTALIAALAIFASPVIAQTQGAHFFSAVGSILPSGALNVSYDEAGVGNRLINYTLTALGSATYICLNKGGNHPQDQKKISSQTLTPTTFSDNPENGRAQGDATIGPISAQGFSCPSGQSAVLACVSYTNVLLTDTTNQVSTGLTAGVTSAILTPNVKGVDCTF
jgi:hypothetical protein